MPTTDCAPPVSARAAVRSENLSHAKRLEARLLSWGLRDALRSSVVVAVPRKLEQSTRPDDAGDSERLSATIIFECARLLRKYPYLNGFCSGAQAQLYEPVNIGYALDAGRGLKVPVFRDADTKSLTVLVEDRRQLLVEYLNDELRPESMSAGTFTITDLSGEGVYTFEPLIVEGQSAILGVGGEFPAPRRGDTVYNLILAFDHRMVDGRMAASFLNDLSQRLQAHDGSGPAVDGSGEPRPQLRCAQCYVTGPEIRAARGFLVQVADSSSDEPSFVCTTCLQGW
jgi:hypothetical protein